MRDTEDELPERPRKKKREYSWKSRWRVKKGKQEAKRKA
jgi:hypothetical protein